MTQSLNSSIAQSRFLLLALLLSSSCGPGATPDPPQPHPPAIDPAAAGTIRGRALFRGTPPRNPKLPLAGNADCARMHDAEARDDAVLVRDGRLRNVFVRVKEGLGDLRFPWPTEPVTISNARCLYAPRVSGARVHQPIRFVNDDPTAHNVHGPAFNFTLSAQGQAGTVKLREPQVMLALKCDLHPWMIGYVGVVEHPFFAVTGDDGGFELRGLPAGSYVVEAWHEKYPAQERRVTVPAAGAAEVDFVYGD